MNFTLHIISIFILILCGFYARKKGFVSAQGTTDLAKLTVHIVYPALIFASITSLSIDDLQANIWLPPIVMLIAMTGLGMGLIAIQFMRNISPPTARAFLFHCLVNNYLYLPLPLVFFLYGERGVALLVFSSIGYELIVWTLGVFIFTGRSGIRNHLKGILNPPLITLTFSLGWVLVRDLLNPFTGPFLMALGESIDFIVQTLGQATIAIVVIIAGSRFAVLKAQPIKDWRLWLLSAIRLILVPLFMIPILYALPLNEATRGIVFIIAAMPSAMVGVLFSERYGGDAEFIAGGLLTTHAYALITVPLFLSWLL